MPRPYSCPCLDSRGVYIIVFELRVEVLHGTGAMVEDTMQYEEVEERCFGPLSGARQSAGVASIAAEQGTHHLI